MKKTILLLAACFLLPVFANTPLLTVWNGEEAARGGGWAVPRNEANSIKTQTATAYSGDTALEFQFEGNAWLGGGWNWFSWWPEDAGTDTTAFTHLVFRIQQHGDVQNLTVSLASSSNKNASEPVRLADYFKNVVLDAREWHQAVIPLADFKSQEDKPFDPKTVWEITFGTWAQHSRTFTLFIDDIGFEKREPKIEW